MMTRRMGIVGRLALVLIAATVPALSLRAQAPAPQVADLIKKSTNAFNDLKFREADSLAKVILSMGGLTPEQRIAALQLRAAALFPEEPSGQQEDSAKVVLKDLNRLGVKGLPKELSWQKLDAMYEEVVKLNRPARIWLGSRNAGAAVLIAIGPWSCWNA